MTSAVKPQEACAIAKGAYLYGYPMVDSYRAPRTEKRGTPHSSRSSIARRKTMQNDTRTTTLPAAPANVIALVQVAQK